jgi:hypothetical protein
MGPEHKRWMELDGSGQDKDVAGQMLCTRPQAAYPSTVILPGQLLAAVFSIHHSTTVGADPMPSG